MAKNKSSSIVKTSGGASTVVKVVAILLVLIAAAYVVVSLVFGQWNPLQWNAARQEQYQQGDGNGGTNQSGNASDEVNGDADEEQAPEENCFVVNESEPTDEGMQVLSAKLPRAAYSANGISAQAETAYLLTATIEPEDVEDKTVDWSVAWENSSSSWASGKTVTDYVRIVPTSDGALTANAECIQAFAEKVIITVTPRTGFENVKGTCTADYVQKVLGIGVTGTANSYQGAVLYSLDLDPSDLNPVIEFPPHTNSMDWEYGYKQYGSYSGKLQTSTVYTKAVSVGYYDYKVCATADYLNALRAGGLSPYSSVSGETYIQNGSNKLDSFFFHNWVSGWFSSSANFSAFRTSLRNNSDKVMLKVQCKWGDANNPETCTYNIRFSNSSLAAIATDVSINSGNISF